MRRLCLCVLALLVPCCLTWTAQPFRSRTPSRAVSLFSAADSPLDPAAQNVIDAIVKQELVELAKLSPEEQEERLPLLLARCRERAADELGSAPEAGTIVARGDAASAEEARVVDTTPFDGDDDRRRDGSYRFGDISRAVAEATRGEVRRQMDAEWSADDVSLLLKVALFLGAGAAAPAAGLAAMPAAAVIATYGVALKAELGARAVSEVGVRLAEGAARGISDGVKQYTGKDEYAFGDISVATVKKLSGNEDYEFGDITKSAVKSVTGKDEYEFGDITKTAVKKVTGKDKYEFGDITKSVLKRFRGDSKAKGDEEKGG